MTDYINEFMDRKIGLDIQNSKAEDIAEISRIIDQEHYDKIDHDECPSLYDYWNECLNERWKTCVYEPDMEVFNAYRDESTKQFEQNHIIMTAEEMLGNNMLADCQVKENDIMSLINN